jgi:hypothetical protein
MNWVFKELKISTGNPQSSAGFSMMQIADCLPKINTFLLV